MDRQLPDSVIRRRKLKILLLIIVGLVLVGLALGGFRRIIKPTIKRSRIMTAIAEIGTIEDALISSGIVVPEFEQVITSPIQSKIDSVFIRAGEIVTQGQSIVKLDDEFIQMKFNKLADEHQLKINRKKQHSIEMERELLDLNARYDILELRTQYSKSKYEMEKQLMELGAGTKEALELAELNHSIVSRELDQLRQQIKNKKESLKADLKEHDLQIRISDESLNELRRQMELAKVRAGREGVVTWVNENIGSAVNPGEEVARVADLSSFKVEATISDIHAAKLVVGALVKVRITDFDLTGNISGIRPTIKNGVVTFLIELDDKRNPSLRSNLRVDVFVIMAAKDNVVRVENGPFISGSGFQDIFVITGHRAIRKTVTVGATNFDYVELTDQINPGDEIIISDMERYIHYHTIDVKDD
jgi:HlyD family secretion protein